MNTTFRLTLFAALLSLFPYLTVAQNPSRPNQASTQTPVKKNPLVPYAGNWVGTFEGKPWMLLNLNLTGEQFSGSMQRAKSIDLNDNGELKRVSEEFSNQPLAGGTLNPDGLVLTFKDSETQETFRYLMKLTSDSTVEIRMIAMAMPPGMPKPKPWKLTKEASASPQPQR